MLDPRKDLLDVFPVDDTVVVNMIARYLSDSIGSCQAEELCVLHGQQSSARREARVEE